jgi:predicted acyl esterase
VADPQGTSERVWITVGDGTKLAATLHLPALRKPVPAVLEALPYRKDDLTAGYRPEYVRLRDEHGYAVVRVDVRGTGSSEGIASDEYPPEEINDLTDVIAWIADQPWCTGSIGMYGTSYSGFNSLHLAAARPPALKAVIGIYSSDDRYTDDVHYMGGLVKLLDLVDYPLYMVAMNALPAVPSPGGEDWRTDWRDAWRERIEQTEPWLLTWLEQQHDGEFWRRGSIRPAYERIGCPTMLVGGWADGYRNNTFRTVKALADAGVPHRLLLGPWAHASAETALPGPRIDLVAEMVRWWDRWLKGEKNGIDDEPPITVFARRSSPPLPDLDEVAGEWRNEPGWLLDRVVDDVRTMGDGIVTHVVVPDTGTAAWISCAGHLPWGQPTDQRYDDAASLTWEWPADDLEILGHGVLHARVAADVPVATLAVRLCDVYPDGRSTLITRGTLNLTHRNSHEKPEPLPVNGFVDVEVELEATSWTFDPGHRMRLAVCGTDWPNTVAPPEPVTLSLDLSGTTLVLPRVDGPSPCLPPTLTASTSEPSEPTDVTWRVERDVLRHQTSCVVESGSTYDEDGVTCTDHYVGRVTVDTMTFAQQATGTTTFTLAWPDVTVTTEVRMVVDLTTDDFVVNLELDCREGSTTMSHRSWTNRIPRRLG